MSLPLDHIVIAVNDLQKAISDYHHLGFTVTPGGDHPGRATHNALVVFQDGAYFELIAWKGPEAHHPWWPKLQQFGPGIVDFALLPSTTTETVAQALSRGLAYQPPVNGGRLRPDGVELRWQNARPITADLPFLCGDVTPRALRVPEGDVRNHANGVHGVAQLRIAVHDLAASLKRYQALLGLDSTPDLVDEFASLHLGTTVLQLETAKATPEAAAQLAHQGEGPFAIGLYTPHAAQLQKASQEHSHGAAITWIPAAGTSTHPLHANTAFA